MIVRRHGTCLTLILVALSACGGDSGSQSSPESLVKAAYQDISAGEFEKVCDLVLPEARTKFTQLGSDCQTYLAKQYDPQTRTSMKDVEIDSAKTRRNGDTAVVPEDAVTFDGTPSSDDDTATAKRDGKWWLTLDQ